MIQVIDPDGNETETIDLTAGPGPQRTQQRGSRSQKPYARKESGKLRRDGKREDDPVKQADKLAADLAKLKLTSRAESSSRSQ